MEDLIAETPADDFEGVGNAETPADDFEGVGIKLAAILVSRQNLFRVVGRDLLAEFKSLMPAR
jgi:hypothetical protein